MEVFGGVASILAIVDIAAKLTKTTASIVLKLKDAPSELAGVRKQVELIKTLLYQVQQSQALQIDPFIPQNVLVSLQTGLKVTEEAIISLQEACVQLPTTDSKRANLRWVFLQKAMVDGLGNRLRNSEIHLGLVLQLISS
jgi:hypothetical protein